MASSIRSLTCGLALVALAWGCSPPPPPPPADPPRVSISAPGNNLADTKLDLDINVSGCDAVAAIELWNHQTRIGGYKYSGNPTRITLPAKGGFPGNTFEKVAADLSLYAKAACSDGRQNASTPVSVRFFPVEEVVKPPAGSGQVVTDVFWVDGSGQNAGFIGCSGNPNGTTTLVRVNRAGELVAYTGSMPFPCSLNSWITDRNLASGKRWLVEPGVGAFAFDAQMNITTSISGPVKHLGVGPDGDAVIYFTTEAIQRFGHNGGPAKWTYAPPGIVTANPIVQSTFGIYVPVYIDDFGQSRGTFAVQNIDYTNGVGIGRADLVIIPYGVGDPAPIPPAAFNQDGSIVYFSYQTAVGVSTVVACSTNQTGCTSAPNKRWEFGSLPGSVVALIPYATGSIVAAITPQYVWFLDAQSGSLLNREGKPISPEGALVTVAVQPGLGRDFYILNGSGQPGTLPVEIVGVDAPESGELFRHSVVGSSLNAGMDEAGALWLRIGGDLVRPLSLVEYQLVVKR